MHETKEQVVEEILENAEHRPWKIVAAVYGKLPIVFMRQQKMSHAEALTMTNVVVQGLGQLSDDNDINDIRNKLLARINI